MTNTFDFQVVQVSSTRKADLLKAGVAAHSIRSELLGYKTYRSGARYPRHGYVASVGHFEPMDRQGADACAAEWRAKGLSPAVRYFAMD